MNYYKEHLFAILMIELLMFIGIGGLMIWSVTQ